ncbi:gamma-glutamyltranspeptidase / glutathione hydrolase [Cyclobacterium lianum]|uniref:Glutathione hydrolase proenzyme n=1 Tax=Cyclobacterium lianum TaxID=388280 RepID=A0A1M7Q5R4_9BACT|nr:gamma-glutamyltransferase [Cyclobacterium lianum]SHN25672.1 gamma-glutamyltranspeptidase / glutathione hydrolase [Cyclobacterium lianum]
MKAIFSILLLLTSVPLSQAQDRLSGKSFATRSEVLATNGMAATNHPLATQIAIDILKRGGTAVDAAIAANAFLGFADPGNNGIGGDLFAIVWDEETQELYGLNASGKSPANLSVDQFKAEIEAGKSRTKGPLSVTTPGTVGGWFALHEKFGALEFSDLLQPAINYAREGIPVSSEVSDNFSTVNLGPGNPSFEATYFTSEGRLPHLGELFSNPDLANTLEIIAEQGRDGFYAGEVAQTIADQVQMEGGYLSAEDLANNAPEWVDPVSINYRGYDIWEMPPNGQGMAALQMLNILKGFDLASMGYGSAAHIHTFLEAKKLAYADMSTYYGDPNFGTIPLEQLLSEEYAAERRKLIDPERAGAFEEGLTSGDHTIYLTVADGDGNMVSLIQSNSALFGSRVVPAGLGFVLQNRGAGFILEEGHINVYAPGKRPFHTIIPAFVTKDGKPFMSFGLMGGDMQTQGHAQIIMNIIDFKMNLQEAGDAPRIYHRDENLKSGGTYLESGFDYEVIRDLMDKGHTLRMGKGIFGGYQAIMLKDGVYYGASESRKDGQAAGY